MSTPESPAVESYPALALQLSCHAVNRCDSVESARLRMQENLDHAAERLSDPVVVGERFAHSHEHDVGHAPRTAFHRLGQEIGPVDSRDLRWDPQPPSEPVPSFDGKQDAPKKADDAQQTLIAKDDVIPKQLDALLKLTKTEAAIDWRQSAAAIDRQIRAFNPWPVAQTGFEDANLRVWRAHAISGVGAQPGLVMNATRNGIDVATGFLQGFLALHHA